MLFYELNDDSLKFFSNIVFYSFKSFKNYDKFLMFSPLLKVETPSYDK